MRRVGTVLLVASVAVLIAGAVALVGAKRIEPEALRSEIAACEGRGVSTADCERYARQRRVCRDGFLSEGNGGFMDIDSCAHREPARARSLLLRGLGTLMVIVGLFGVTVATILRRLGRHRVAEASDPEEP